MSPRSDRRRWRRSGNGVDATELAAERIDPSDRKEGERRARSAHQWQREAWSYYDEVPELWFGMNYIANALRRVRIFPATWDDSHDAPIPLDRSTALGARANAELDRLRGADKTHGTIIHDMALQLSVPGEGYVAGWDVQTKDASGAPVGPKAEKWGAYSTEELTYNTSQNCWTLKKGEGDQAGEEVPNEAVIMRFWRPHPRYHYGADSALRPLLGACKELLQLDRMYRSEGRSRTNAGVLLVPEEAELRSQKRPGQKTSEGQGMMDPFVRALLTALVTPVTDDDSAANVAPGVIKIKGDLIEKFKHLVFNREFDATAAARYDRLLKRVSDGIDLPAGITQGLEKSNHWSAWFISQEAFDQHLASLVELICAGVTEAFLATVLDDSVLAGASPVICWYDASALISHPSKSADADKAFENLALSYEAYRRYKGYSEDDAPDDAEVAKRVEIAQKMKPQGGPGGEVDQPPKGASLQGPPSLTASAAIGRALGRRLAQLDQQLRSRIQLAIDEQVAAVTAAATSADQVDWVAIADEYDVAVSEVQAEVRALALEYDEELDVDSVMATQDDDRDRGWGVLTAAVTAWIAHRAASPAAHAPALGEVSAGVPAGVVRVGLAVAGGAPEHLVSTAQESTTGTGGAFSDVLDEPLGGVATGVTALDTFTTVGLQVGGWVWVYGNSARPFPGHEALDGVEFSSFSDDVLTVDPDDAWIGRDTYCPGDHGGCECDFAPVLLEDGGDVGDAVVQDEEDLLAEAS